MNRIRSRGLAAAAGAIAVLWCWGSPAIAEVGAPGASVQAIAADAQFLEYAPPPAAPGVVCLIDSGVDQNPDTTPILAGSYALQPGTDTADELSKLNPPVEPGNHPNGHGTYMAMIMAAPVNGWGMVGIAPTSVRVFNLKALAAGKNTFAYPVYANSIVDCEDGPAGVSGITVVNLSLASGTQPTQADVDAIHEAVADAHARGLSVVAAAGNDSGTVGYPAASGGVMAVGATDANPASLGVFCATSNRGPALGILAPGCGSQSEPGGGGDGIDVAFSDDGSPAWDIGTSDSAAIVSAVLASMRAYRPDLAATEAETCLTSTASNGGNLDAAAAFRACGLGTIVDEGLAAYDLATRKPTQPMQQIPGLAASPAPLAAAPARKPALGPAEALGRPRVLSVRVRPAGLVVRFATVASGARVRVSAERAVGRARYRVLGTTTTSGNVATLAVSHWDRLAISLLRGSVSSGPVYVNRTSKLVRE